MAFQGLCRILGKTGVFDMKFEHNRIVYLNAVETTIEPAGGLPWISPGFFDIQVNGMIGINLSDPELTEEGVLKVEAALEARGILKWCPTITTTDAYVVRRNLGLIAKLIDDGKTPNIAGIHLEGHFISSEAGYRGVHMEQYIRDPDPIEMEEWFSAAKGHISIFSLAPERKGAIEFIKMLRTRGVRVGLAHHQADYETIRKATVAGADLSTHLLNGCAKVIHRQENVIWAQLSLDELWSSFIADGYHIPHYTLRALIRAKGISRSILVSDLAHLSGMPDGEYSKNGNTVAVKNGGLWVKGEGTDLLSGAVKTLDQDCEYLVNAAGFSWEDAFLMASVNPARYLRHYDWLELYTGRTGKIVILAVDLSNKLKVTLL